MAITDKKNCFWFNRWFTYVSALFCLFCGGTAYLWGTYSEDVKTVRYLQQSELNLLGVSFYFAQIANLGVGILFDRFGPRPIGWASALTIALGYYIFYLGLNHGFHVLVLSFSLVLVGLGSGGIYSASVAPNIANFDARYKGVVVGILVAMYGGSSAALAQLYRGVFIKYFPDRTERLLNFIMTLSVGLGAIGVIGVVFLNYVVKKPRVVAETTPLIEAQQDTLYSEVVEPDNEVEQYGVNLAASAYPQFTWRQTITSINFWLLFVSFVIGVGAGGTVFATIGQLSKSLGQVDATTFVILQAIFNALSRVFMGFFSDLLAKRLSRPGFLAGVMLLYVATHILLSFSDLKLLIAGVIMTGFCYGSIYVLVPVMVNELFGGINWGTNYSIVGCGPAVGNYLFVRMQAAIYQAHAPAGSIECTGIQCFQMTFWIIAGLCLFSSALASVLWFRTRDMYKLKLTVSPDGKLY